MACANSGLCDLSTGSPRFDLGVLLKGEWQFYWQQLLSPQDIEQGKGTLSGYLSPDVDWIDANLPGIDMHAGSFATYHLNFNLSGHEPMTLWFPRMPSAVRVWLNGQVIQTIGELSTDGKEATARQRQFLHTFIPKSGVNTITIEISNYSFAYHGWVGGIVIGKPEPLRDSLVDRIVRDAISFGAILIMAFYHFYLWWMRKIRLSPLYFGSFCLAVGLRSLVAGQGQIMAQVFPETPLELQLKIEYIGIAIGLAALTLLVHDLYPREFKKYVAYPIAAIAGAWALLILGSSGNIFPRFLRFFQLLVAFAGTWEIISLVVASLRRREGAVIFLMGFGIFFTTGLADILSAMEITESPPMSHIGTFALIFFQSILLSKRFDRAFDQAERAEREVRVLNEGLEQKVKERTEEINVILRNVSSGFLLINRNGKLRSGFTESCHQLLDTRLKAGDALVEILKVDQSTKQMLRGAVAQVYENFLPLDVALSQIPSRVKVAQRTLGISGAALVDSAERPEAILFTITDVSELQEAERSILHNEMLIHILRERASFRVFLEDFRKEIAQSLSAIESGCDREVRNLLHTMKGNLGAFGMHQMAEMIHEMEGRSHVKADDIRQLSLSVDSLLRDNESLLELEEKSAKFELPQEDYDAIIDWGTANLDSRQRQELRLMLKRACQKPIRSYVGPLKSTAEALGKRLGKTLKCQILGADMHVDETLSPLLRNLVHLVRNAVDHGIEMPEDRGDKGEQGQIVIDFKKSAQTLRISVKDDGCGLNTLAIKAKAKKLGLLPNQDQNLSDEEIYRFIFAPGFSTAEEVSDISGRGVGMSSISAVVEELSGTLKVESRLGLGVSVLIEVPLSREQVLAAASGFEI